MLLSSACAAEDVDIAAELHITVAVVADGIWSRENAQ